MSEAALPQAIFNIEKLYVKDLSLEIPHAPGIFLERESPQIDLQLHSEASSVEEGMYEVAVTVTVTAKLADKVAYLIEVQQAGIFNAAGFSAGDMGAILGSYCPNILFPFVREVISDVVTKGGFPQLVLAPVNFDALYAQHVQQQSSPQQVAH